MGTTGGWTEMAKAHAAGLKQYGDVLANQADVLMTKGRRKLAAEHLEEADAYYALANERDAG